MIKHIALWRFSDPDNAGKNRENAITIKAGIEELAYVLHGVAYLTVRIDPLAGAREDRPADIMVEGLFESPEAFAAYMDDPRRRAVAELVAACTDERLEMNYLGE